MKEFRVALVIGLLLSVGAYTVYAASAKISADATVTPASGDYIPIVQAGVNKKSTAAGLVTYITSTGTFQPKEATLTDIADGTIAENLVNTANPWADNEVADTLTVGASGAVDNDALDDDLKAVGELATTGGTAVRTAPNTWALRTITGTANEITVANGNGISGNPTIELPDAVTISGTMTAGSFSTPQSASSPDRDLRRGPGTNGRGVYHDGPAAEPAATWGMTDPATEPTVGQIPYVLSGSSPNYVWGWTDLKLAVLSDSKAPTAAQMGNALDVIATTGGIPLPVGVVGMQGQFLASAACSMGIHGNTDESIYLAGSAITWPNALTNTSAAADDRIQLTCTAAKTWRVTDKNGTWASANIHPEFTTYQNFEGTGYDNSESWSESVGAGWVPGSSSGFS